jgi:hypothetical protein
MAGQHPFPGQHPPAGYPMPASNPTKISISVWLGLVSLVAWFLPLIGLPLSLISIGKGLNDLYSRSHRLARTGIYISLIGLMFTMANAAIGFYMGYKGEL